MAAISFTDLLAAAGDAGFSLLPNGPYDVKVFAVEAKKSGKGKDMFAIQYEILSGPHMGRKIKNNLTISPESPIALGFFFREMKAMGLAAEFFQTNPTPQVVAATLVGKVCRIEVGKGSFNNEERDEVKKVMPPLGGAAAAPVMASAPQPKAQPKAQPVAQTPPPAPVSTITDTIPTSSEYLSADPNAPEVPF
jgi:hypothetical protein